MIEMKFFKNLVCPKIKMKNHHFVTLKNLQK